MLTYLYLGISILTACIVRFNLLDMPLERDEGEYAYMGQLLLEGIPPYKLAYNMKLPGAYFFYAIIIKIFGDSFRAIHIGFLLVNILCTIGIHFFTQKILNNKFAFLSSISFAIYSSSSAVLGFAFHATHLVLLFFIFGLLIYMAAIEKKNNFLLFVSGILFGLSFLMKQQAISLLIFSCIYLILHNYFIEKKNFYYSLQKIFFLTIGILIPFVNVCIYLYINGVFSDFWFWTFEYASKYVSLNSPKDGIHNLISAIKGLYVGYEIYWVFVFLGLLLLPILNIEKSKKYFLYFLFFFSFFTTIPGFFFRGHYFIPFLPFLIIFSTIPLYYIDEKFPNKYISILTFLVLLIGIRNAIQRDKSYFFKDSPERISRVIYYSSPIPEAIKISDFINKNSNESDTITILGSEPEIYFYSKRKSTTGFIYMYPLMENHRFNLELQSKMVMEIDKKEPKFIIFINNELDYFKNNVRKENLVVLFDWIEKFKRETKYEKVGVVEILLEETKYNFGGNLKNYKYSYGASIDIYQKKN